MTKFDGCLKWFKGKALENAKTALAMLAESDANGAWLPGHSRKVEAALNKCVHAHKAGREVEKVLGELKDGTEKEYGLGAGWTVAHAMNFGATKSAPKALESIAAIKAHNKLLSAEELAALATAEGWARDFAAAGETMKRLDATRPKPVYFLGTLSATVLGNVGKAMAIDLKSLKMPEMEWVEVEKVDEKGRKYNDWVVKIHWPEGTKHNTSKFAGNFCCHACGHAIKNPHNWVPLVAETPNGPASLWTGKDCAENLFGCTVRNPGKIEGSPAV